MAVVGFGKQPGAAQIHACGPEEMRDRLLDGIAALRATGRLLGGVGSIESRRAVVAVRALTAEEVGTDVEMALTERRATFVPPLPFADIDVLIIEQGGKDITGTTMDPNVTGRFWVHGLEDSGSADGSARSCCSASPKRRAATCWASGSPTSSRRRSPTGSTGRRPTSTASPPGPPACAVSRMPMVLPTEEDCIKAALRCAATAVDEPKRVVRIRRRCT